MLILHDLARTVDRLRQHGIYHKDLHHENVVIGCDHVPFVVDFGGAKMHSIAKTDPGELEAMRRVDTYDYFRHMKDLFPLDDPNIPQCVRFVRERIHNYELKYDLARACDTFAQCQCGNHQYRDAAYFLPLA